MPKRLRIRLVVIGLAILLVALGTFVFVSGRLTSAMLHDYGYFRWTQGKSSFLPDYEWTFGRDYRFARRFVGQPIESLRPLFPELRNGGSYPRGSYRAMNIRTITSSQNYWLNGTEDSFGWCAVVVDGKIQEFVLVKG